MDCTSHKAPRFQPTRYEAPPRFWARFIRRGRLEGGASEPPRHRLLGAGGAHKAGAERVGEMAAELGVLGADLLRRVFAMDILACRDGRRAAAPARHDSHGAPPSCDSAECRVSSLRDACAFFLQVTQ